MKQRKFTPRCNFEYSADRDRDLMNTYKKVFCESEGLTTMQLLAKTVKMPARRFYVSEERAVRVVSSMYRRPLPESVTPTRRRMFEEIKRRTDEMRKKEPEWSLSRCIMCVVMCPAPEFFISINTAKNLICQYRIQCRKEQRQKFQQWHWLQAR